ncbi:MAG: HAMP domain-containing histidine kinase [Gracilibacteraceae bacterium]|jgi:signal transduction histidine kinase|nr:HAMP domain-containing histidine kinase [Gracilibacteraceae bacterium]
MSKRFLLLLVAVLAAGIILLAVLISQGSDTRLDMAEANDIVRTIAEEWDEVRSGGALHVVSDMGFVVFDERGRAVAGAGYADGTIAALNDALHERFIIMDVVKNGQIVGKVGFENDIQAVLNKQRSRLIVGVAVLIVVLAWLCAVYTYYLHRRVVVPFRKMQGFAQRVAAGDLEIPLAMDRSHLFGAFTESFDIMREELRRARESEREANRSKKELVASLSHDIKTPVATIKAVVEVMAMRTQDGKEKNQLAIIETKAEQINSLITNMFHTTLEELQELKVNPAETPSTDIAEFIRAADYEGRVREFTLTECIVLADALRLSQVFDNIIGNSYKYAGTDIIAESSCEDDFLILNIQDFGAGVPRDEIPMITGKFYRGSNAEGLSGYGLGLYISKYLMDQMRGDLICENAADGFSVKIFLRIA